MPSLQTLKSQQRGKERLKIPKRNPRTVEPDRLYRLRIVDRNVKEGLVKVKYVGYRREFDEWRPQEEVVNIDDDCDDEENSDTGDYHFTGPIPA